MASLKNFSSGFRISRGGGGGNKPVVCQFYQKNHKNPKKLVVREGKCARGHLDPPLLVVARHRWTPTHPFTVFADFRILHWILLYVDTLSTGWSGHLPLYSWVPCIHFTVHYLAVINQVQYQGYYPINIFFYTCVSICITAHRVTLHVHASFHNGIFTSCLLSSYLIE